MSNPKRAVFIGLGLVASVACGVGDTESTSSAAAALTGACPATTYLYELPAWIPSCPAIAGWNHAPLFGSSTAKPLDRYCSYEWAGAGVPSPNHVGPLAAGLIVATNSQNQPVPDCPVVSVLGLADTAEINKPLYKAFLAQSGHVPVLPKGVRVRTAVIDTAVRGYGSSQSDLDPHGRAVGRVIGELACPDGGFCAAEIVNSLGLPQVDVETTDYVGGGHFGSRGQLAAAIVRAVDDWAYDFSKAPKKVPPRLILNLSVGWVPEYGGMDLEKMPLPARAVYDALVHAACYGALTLAAAGNSSGDGSKGPMLPGGWETLPAPTQCKGAYSKLPSPFPLLPSGGYASLLTAVSAVDETDRPLSSTRQKGQARLTAYGNQVVTPESRGADYTPILTGTSMATAIASAAAAAVWSQRPDLTFAEVAQLLYDKGAPLDPGEPTGHAKTEFCLNGVGCNAHELRRVSVCSALRASVDSAGAWPLPECKTVPPHLGDRVPWPADLSAVYPMPEAAPGPTCDPAPDVIDSCELDVESHLDSPWVDPQPIPGCDVCLLSLDGQAYLDFTNPGFAYLRGLTVLTFDQRRTLLSAQRVLSPLGSHGYPEVFRAGINVPRGTASAELNMTYVDGSGRLYSRVEPLRLY